MGMLYRQAITAIFHVELKQFQFKSVGPNAATKVDGRLVPLVRRTAGSSAPHSNVGIRSSHAIAPPSSRTWITWSRPCWMR
jgi:hypothetical protein